MNKISVIIPSLNEEEHIEHLLKWLISNSNSKNIEEIIVVDGGSTDKTLELLKGFDSVRTIIFKKGRAIQLNEGARVAQASVLYFLHADSLPPENFDSYILSEIEKGHRAGCFRLQFDSKHWWLQLAGWFTQFNWRICRGGDQSLFIDKNLFIDIGGYDERYFIYEDNVLIKELFKRNSHTVINKPIQTSARLYKKKGIWKLQVHFWRIHLMHQLGASPEKLFRYYQTHISG